jgi:DNA-binding transcriptional regulator YhcF (GntR family)
MNILVDDGLIEKKRGIGMFVLDGAKEKVRMIRKEEFLTKDVNKLIEEAKKLNINLDELKEILERGYRA